MLHLRSIAPADIERLFEWRNTPFIMQLGSLQKEVCWDEHRNWFNASLESSDRKIFIIEQGGLPIGQVRFDKINDNSCTISIYLLEQFTGKGWGLESIKIACTRIFQEWENIDSISAVIRNENIISLKSFMRAGFIQTAKQDDSNIEHELTYYK